ncbi:MAG: transposase family protein [Myxococcota bacterium]
MAFIRYRRQAATPKGFLRRIKDIGFARVGEPRQQSKVQFPLPTVLATTTLALTSGANSMRDIERRSEQAKDPVREELGLTQRLADNTIGGLLPRLSPLQLRPCLHRTIKAEFERKNLDLEHALVALFVPVLDSDRFDACQA